jgi:hypothetical protein
MEAFSESEMPFMFLCVSKPQKFNSKTHGTHEEIQLRNEKVETPHATSLQLKLEWFFNDVFYCGLK